MGFRGLGIWGLGFRGFTLGIKVFLGIREGCVGTGFREFMVLDWFLGD